MEFKIIKDQLTLGEMIQFTNDVVSSAYVREDDGSLGEYSPILKEIALKYYFVKYFTDYELSEEMEENYTVFAGADLFGAVYENSAAANQYMDIVKAADEKIGQINGEKCAYIVASGLSSFAEGLLMMTKKIGQAQDIQNEVAKESEKLIQAQLKQTEFMNEVTAHFSDEEYAELIRKQGNEEINVKEIAGVVTDRYLNSAQHKKSEEEQV